MGWIWLGLVLLAGQDFSALRRQVAELGKLTKAPAVRAAEGVPADGALHAIYFDGLPYRSKPTRVFAWYGTPDRHIGKVPAVVLVHGGGGTAYKEWVKKWNEHGFAAISIAVEGQTDTKQEKQWERHPWAGPARDNIYNDSSEPLADQWMYHAIADTVLANSLLRSFPEVDAKKVGLMGISWGGVIASTVMGIDTRFAFSIPTYGCGDLADTPNQYGAALHGNALYREVWDPLVWLPHASMPALWFSWPDDVHFPMTSQKASYDAAPGPHMVAILPGMKHGHPAGWNPPDSYAFAESVVGDGKPWFGQTSDGGVFSKRPIDKAVLFSTADAHSTVPSKWTQTPAAFEQDGTRVRVTTAAPDGAQAWFINFQAGDLTASSNLVLKR
jgi:dienelactone hydrolase